MGDYAQEMKSIWDRVANLPEGQDKVGKEQLWRLGKTGDTSPTLEDYPALVTYKFLIEELVDGKPVYRPISPNLKDFWRKNIKASQDHGYQLLPFREELNQPDVSSSSDIPETSRGTTYVGNLLKRSPNVSPSSKHNR